MPVVRPGDYACVPIAGSTGKIIEVLEWANGDGFRNYEHAEIYVGGISPDAPYGYTFGAYPGGARRVALRQPAAELQGALWSSGRIQLTAAQRVRIVASTITLNGTPYSFLDYAALTAHRLHLPAPGLETYISSTHHLICSQLVDYCYSLAGVTLFDDNRWPGDVTPEDLANLILTGPPHA